MKFNWMDRGKANSPEEIKTLARQLDEYGYYCLLLTYHSLSEDMLTKSLLAAENNVNLKFMLAIRTYAISPEYMAMICRSYQNSFKDKLILNIASGDIHKEETSVEDIVFLKEQISSPEQRLDYTKEWIEKFIQISSKPNWYSPKLIMSGHSEKTREMANKFDATSLVMLNTQKQYVSTGGNIINKKQMIALSVCIRDNKEQAYSFIEKNTHKEYYKACVYGNKEEVKKELLDLFNNGADEILISAISNDDNIIAIHELVKEILYDNTNNRTTRIW